MFAADLEITKNTEDHESSVFFFAQREGFGLACGLGQGRL